ncbi:Carbamoyl-phosphate synthase [Kickxella alabastrina]|uniref:Carbamoyl-phosphate synthase n=1 Tax=Kickxella alabastrina TaxID=61397 RepID=A0ACC1IR78_9FUNG|nr:Carbamoyl-phosphate synthase [Kickxella alabastrina]
MLSRHSGKSPFYIKHELNIRQFLHEDFYFYFAITQEIHTIIMQLGRCLPLLARRFMAAIFCEPSSHISSLFQAVMLRLGSQVVSIINAGDGIGEHLLQAMLDAFTIREVLGTVSSLIITLASELCNGYTVHSLACVLAQYKKVTSDYVSPPSLTIPKSIKGDVALNAPCVMQNKLTTLTDNVLVNTDVLYITCMQKEHFDFLEE